jgi:hypothetical protein
MSFLSALGKDFKAVFSWIGSAKGQATIATVEGASTAVVSVINPAAGVAMGAVEDLINAALKQVVSVESLSAAAEAQSGTGTQKLAAVVSVVAPQVSATLQTLGVKEPAASEVQSISTVVANSLVSILNAFPPSTAA